MLKARRVSIPLAPRTERSSFVPHFERTTKGLRSSTVVRNERRWLPDIEILRLQLYGDFIESLCLVAGIDIHASQPVARPIDVIKPSADGTPFERAPRAIREVGHRKRVEDVGIESRN